MSTHRCHQLAGIRFLLTAFAFAGLALLLGSTALDAIAAAPVAEVLGSAARLRDQGDFKQAGAVLSAALADHSAPLAATDRSQLSWQLELLERIRQDYSLTEAELVGKLEKSVQGFTRAEFAQWLAEGRFDSRVIDGVRRFVGVSVSNLFFRHPELNPRRQPPVNDDAYFRSLHANAVAIKQATARSAAEGKPTPYVLPKRFSCVATITVDSNAAPDGELVRAWVPVPRQYPFQGEFKALDVSAVKQLAGETSPIRSAYLEATARRDRPTVFSLSYAYTAYGVHFDLDPAKVTAGPVDPAAAAYTREAPHIVFTDKIKELAAQVAGDETNPLRKAKAFYDWVTGNIQYSFALEYSTIPNISDYCLTKRYGDCGQEALLFMTLCRSQGIPARWQSGWFTFPGHKTIHDWCEIQIAPYGWVPVDPYMGILATRYASSLPSAERRELCDFYFGGLDQYRMIANSDHDQALTPAKKFFRSDDVDFQRAEIETPTRNLYFDQFSCDLKVEPVPLIAPK